MDWQDRARSQAGVIERSQLGKCGLAEHQVRHLIEQRELVEQFSGTYLHRSGKPTALQRM